MDLTPPPGLDLNESQQPQLWAAYISTFSLAVIAVCLRLFCRIGRTRPGLWWDDYVIIASLVVTTANFVTMIIWITRGLGMHIYKFGMQGVTHFFLNLFVIEIFYTLSICFTKYSILLFYWRIFSTSSIRLPIYILTAIVTAWGIGVIITTILQCSPIEGFWNKSIESTCGVDVNNFFIGNAVPNIITDWALLILPLPYIWSLQRNTVQKLAIYATFMLGGFICVISVVRLVIMLDAYKVPSVDLTWVFIGPSTWTAVECNIGVVSACLPSLRPLLRRFGGGASTFQSTGPSSSKYGQSSGKYSTRSWSRVQNPFVGDNSDTNISTAEYGSDHDLTSINVRTTVELREELEQRR